MVRGMAAALREDSRQLTARHVEQVLHLAEHCASGHRTELSGVVVERSFDTLWFEAAAPAAPATATETQTGPAESNSVRPAGREFAHMISLGRPGEITTVAVPEIGRRFRLKMIDWAGQAGETTLRDGAIDGGLLRSPLVLRNWRPGDSLRLQGRRHLYKLKQFLREGRIAVRDRQGWPVLTSAGALVWTRGLPVAAEFAPGENTRTGVLITEEAV
jgi:tRNA(Ile)-lysidine synthetase-like protein